VDFQSKSTDVSFWRKKCKSLKNQLEKKKKKEIIGKNCTMISSKSVISHQLLRIKLLLPSLIHQSKQKPNNQFVLVSSILFDQKLALMRMSC
jgi:hypothetical protein